MNTQEQNELSKNCVHIEKKADECFIKSAFETMFKECFFFAAKYDGANKKDVDLDKGFSSPSFFDRQNDIVFAELGVACGIRLVFSICGKKIHSKLCDSLQKTGWNILNIIRNSLCMPISIFAGSIGRIFTNPWRSEFKKCITAMAAVMSLFLVDPAAALTMTEQNIAEQMGKVSNINIKNMGYFTQGVFALNFQAVVEKHYSNNFSSSGVWSEIFNASLLVNSKDDRTFSNAVALVLAIKEQGDAKIKIRGNTNRQVSSLFSNIIASMDQEDRLKAAIQAMSSDSMVFFVQLLCDTGKLNKKDFKNKISSIISEVPMENMLSNADKDGIVNVNENTNTVNFVSK